MNVNAFIPRRDWLNPANGTAVLMAGCVAVAWMRPEWLVLVASVGAALLGVARLGNSGNWKTWTVVFLGALLLAAKDFLPSSLSATWQWIELLPGAVAPAWTRQPEWTEIARTFVTFAGVGWFVMLARGWCADERVARRWSVFLVILAVLASGWVLLQPTGVQSYGKDFVLAAVPSRNAAAAAFVFVALLAVGVALQAWRDGTINVAAISGVGAAVVALAGVLMGSRGAGLALIVGIGVFAWLRLKRRGTVGWLAGGAAVAVAVAAAITAPESATRVGEISSEYRFTLWRHALEVIREFPWFGCGGGMFVPAFALRSGVVPSLGATVTHPDSSWVLLGFEHGLLGCAALVAMMVALFRTGPAEDERGAEIRWLRDGARAAVAAWAVAACFDVSLHRAALLAIGVPLVGIAWPAGDERRSASSALAAIGVLLLAGLTLAWHSAPPTETLRYENTAGELRLTAPAAAELARHPFDVAAHHALGYSALAAGRADLAARHFEWVRALQPANEEPIAAYARALHRFSPELARPFWKHLFAHAEERAWARLEEAWQTCPREPLSYWRDVTRARPDLLPLLASGPGNASQRCFEAWRRESLALQVQTPLRFVAPAFARWGDADGFAEWVHAAPRWAWGEGGGAADRFIGERRVDLAWVVLARMLPRRPAPDSVTRSVDASLVVRARPGDFAATAALLARGDLNNDERERLLQAAVERPDCPAWFRIEQAYLLAERGETEAAVRALLRVARELHPAQLRDW